MWEQRSLHRARDVTLTPQGRPSLAAAVGIPDGDAGRPSVPWLPQAALLWKKNQSTLANLTLSLTQAGKQNITLVSVSRCDLYALKCTSYMVAPTTWNRAELEHLGERKMLNI